MQFPNPIIRSLVLYDNNGNAVVVLGPGPSIVIKGTTPSGDIEMTSSGGTAQIRFWNQPHTDFGSILAHDVTDGVTNNIVSMIYQGSTRTSVIGPGNPIVHTGMIQDSFLGLPGTWIGNIVASGQAIGAVLGVEDTVIDNQFIDSNGVLNATLSVTEDQWTYTNWILPNTDVLQMNWLEGNGVFRFLGIGNWVNLTLNSGWTAKAGYIRPALRLNIQGTVELRGTMTGGTIVDNTQIATIPAPGFVGAYGHPAGAVLLTPSIAPTGAGTTSRRIFISGTGIFVYGINAGGTQDIGLDSLSYSQLP